METPQQTLTEEVRQAKVYDLIEKFKERKKQSQEQLEKDRNNPKFEASIKRLMEQNEKIFGRAS